MSFLLKTDKTLSKNYQPGVDGLRAVAVILVLIFHVGFSSVPGGFVGVDVFFVISGYLITGIIFNQTEKGTFSYINFMLARIARLYPALIATLIAVFAGCFILYSPSDFVSVSKSAIYALYSASNIFFAQSVGYFDTSSEINPLLHTWSLGVEQQFYLVWPLIIGAAYLVKKSLVPWVLVIISIASLASSQWATINMQTEAYYWMPFRVFELSFGGLAFFISRWIKPSEPMKESMMAAGLAMILSSALLYSSSTQFPGLHAMIPVLGAMLCILSHDAKYAGFAVNNRVSVTIGLISYSVYLIHWPIIVFYKYWISRDITTLEKVSIIFSSLIIGMIFYSLIENRYRKINIKSFGIYQVSFVLLIFIISSSFNNASETSGFPLRISDATAFKIKDAKMFHYENFGGGETPQGTVILGDKKAKPSLIIMGDSLARQYSLAIDSTMKASNKSVIAFFADGCFMSEKYSRLWSGKVGKECIANYMNFVEFAKNNNIPVFYSQRWIGYKDLIGDYNGDKVTFKNNKDFAKFIVENIQNISSNIKGKLYVALGSSGTNGLSGAIGCITRPSYVYQPCLEHLSVKRNDAEFEIVNEYLVSYLNNNKNISLIDINNFICSKEYCPSVDDSGHILYSDTVHFTKYTSSLVWDRIKKIINL
ncbi:acyltransferase [Escherichia coli]|nr:acyltransferase [Escherichia coli]EIB1490738.1 acyltransferase [Escherichia coli]